MRETLIHLLICFAVVVVTVVAHTVWQKTRKEPESVWVVSEVRPTAHIGAETMVFGIPGGELHLKLFGKCVSVVDLCTGNEARLCTDGSVITQAGSFSPDAARESWKGFDVESEAEAMRYCK